MKVLLIEDDVAYSDPLQELLKDNGFDVVLISSRDQIIGHHRGDSEPGIIILDMLLSPKQSAAEGLKNITVLREKYPFVPILVFSEHAEEHWLQQAKNIGANELIRKPPMITLNYFNTILLPQLTEITKQFDVLDFRAFRNQLLKLSEQDLINNIVLPLLRKMGYQGVSPIKHHGPGEFGMDVLPFYKIDEFSERIYYSVQAKVGDIVSRASSRNNITSVLNQAETALKKRFLDIDNAARTVDKVFIVTSGKLSPDAKTIVHDRLEGNRRVGFIDGDRLVNLLDKHDLLYLLQQVVPVNSLAIAPFFVGECSGPAQHWEYILDEVINRLSINQQNKQNLYNRIMDRERTFDTLIGDGIALPHVYNSKHKQHVIALCVSDKKYPWRLSNPKMIDFVALCIFGHDENDETGNIRRSVGGALSEMMTNMASPATSAKDKLDTIIEKLTVLLQNSRFRIETGANVTIEAVTT